MIWKIQIHFNFKYLEPSNKAIFGTNEMYNSEYSNIGRGKVGYIPNRI